MSKLYRKSPLGAWLAQSMDHGTLALSSVNPSLKLGVEIT